MPKITASFKAFNLNSSFLVQGGAMKQSSLTTGTRTEKLAYAIPAGANITSAYLQVSCGSPMYGGKFTVNGTRVDTNKTSQVPVTIAADSTSLDVAFAYTTYGSSTASNGTHLSILEVYAGELVIEYTGTVTACTAPTAGSIAKAEVTTTQNVRVSWSGAKAGDGSVITGYTIQRQDSTDGSSWGSWTGVATVQTEYMDVASGAAGVWRKYRVKANSSAGAAYDSPWYNIPGTLHHLAQGEQPATDAQPHDNMPPYRVVHMWRRVN